MIVQGVIEHIVTVRHLHVVLLQLHHLVLPGPVRVLVPPAGVLHLYLPAHHVYLECFFSRWNKHGALE